MEDRIIYVPETNRMIKISEGTGDNLLNEDIEAGYVDYINYDIYDPKVLAEDIDSVDSEDGGMILFTEYVQDKYKDITEAAPAVLDMAYGNEDMPYFIIERSA